MLGYGCWSVWILGCKGAGVYGCWCVWVLGCMGAGSGGVAKGGGGANCSYGAKIITPVSHVCYVTCFVVN